jgi:Ig-like domain-containing protein
MEDQRADESTQDRSAAEQFAEELRALRATVGNPSFRKMSGRSGRISHTTLHEAAAGTRFPSWETTREFIRACEADEVVWRRRWEAASRAGTVDTATPDGLIAAASPPVLESSPPPVPRAVELLGAAEDELAGASRHRLPWRTAVAVVLVIVAASFVGVIIRGRWSPVGAGAAKATPTPTPSSSKFSDSLIAGDSSKFVGDVTIPDGTKVKVNSNFEKVWALANVGKVVWHNRYLERMNPASAEDGCKVPERVAIGDTPPGENVMISVEVTAPSRPGKCWVGWKMVDEHGKEFFPTRRPVYFMVVVIA